ncbi:unnamed protein product [Cyclocybe aegerita]|uniref:SHSP domain-containing protein n=1 Tax=Cyclocybe aegerita TaxID=1973307 RepID=A0A8S0WB70_CYCAE|nr:unnamed protein product [Cyclocybe aegerita]
MAPRAPPPTPATGFPPAASRSPSSGSSSSSYTPADFSYFSPNAPLTSSAPTSPYASAPDHNRPIITASVTSRPGNTMNAVAASPHNHYANRYHTHPPPPPSDVLQQFALHIPPPPPLSLSLSSRQHHVSPSSSNTSSSSASPVSPMRGGGASQQPAPTPEMKIQSEPHVHMLSVFLPRTISPEMVTISANKGDRLRVVADAWHMEDECHFEWQISFPPYDVDIAKVQAKFDPDGRLTIAVTRRPKGAVAMMGMGMGRR